jgi:hypothetical protein
MAIQEVVIRPGDSISLVLDVPGHPMRLDLSLTRNGVAVSGPVALGVPTMYGGVAPRSVQSEEANEAEMVDLTEEFEAQDRASDAALPVQRVESLAAVEPFGDPQAVDIPFEDISGEDNTGGYGADNEASVAEDATATDDLDLNLDDLDGEESYTVDVPQEDAPVDVPDDDAGLGLEDQDDAGFNADGRTMVPPTRRAAASHAEPQISLEEEVEMDDQGNPKEKFKPNKDDTLPVWTGKASTYKDPNIEHKKETAKLNKQAPGKPTGNKQAPVKLSLAEPEPAKPAPKLPQGKPGLKKPQTGPVGPAAGKKADAEGAGNFTVFLSPPKGADKKQAAAEIIADLQGIDMNSALALAGKMIVPVVKGVTEDEAQTVRDRFKDAGLSCRITQKR